MDLVECGFKLMKLLVHFFVVLPDVSIVLDHLFVVLVESVNVPLEVLFVFLDGGVNLVNFASNNVDICLVFAVNDLHLVF